MTDTSQLNCDSLLARHVPLSKLLNFSGHQSLSIKLVSNSNYLLRITEIMHLKVLAYNKYLANITNSFSIFYQGL